MDLMEYQARELFLAAGLPLLRGKTVENAEDLKGLEVKYPVVVKAQVRTGGRGKAGGVKFGNNEQEMIDAAKAIIGMDIKGHHVEKVMAVEAVDIEREFYLSIILDRNTKKHVVIFSPEGGMEIEQVAKEKPEAIYKMPIDPILGICSTLGMYLGGKAGLNKDQKKELQQILEKLYAFAKNHDCMMAEINPLVLTPEGHIMVCDAKVTVDDSAIFRLPDVKAYKDEEKTAPLIAEAAEKNFLYIPCEAKGNIVVISNGSGMLMSCIDRITKRDMTVSAVLDLGGGATAERIQHAVRILFSTPGAEYLFINIFGGITRCDEVAGGIRKAVEELGVTKPIVVRFEGTNKEKGLEIIQGLPNVTFADGLREGVEVLYEHTH